MACFLRALMRKQERLWRFRAIRAMHGHRHQEKLRSRRRVCRAIARPSCNTKRRRLTIFSVRSMEFGDGDRIGSRSPALRCLLVEAFAAPIDQGGTRAMAHIQDKAAG